MTIGVLADTHGLLRPEVLGAFYGVEHILHAGDIGDAEILNVLRTIAPVTAIRGNIDQAGACAKLPPTEAVELGGLLFYLVHSIRDLDLKPDAAKISVVVSGHSHKPSVHTEKQVLYLNPGSAGPRRFRLPVTVAIVEISDAKAVANLVDLVSPEAPTI